MIGGNDAGTDEGAGIDTGVDTGMGGMSSVRSSGPAGAGRYALGGGGFVDGGTKCAVGMMSALSRSSCILMKPRFAAARGTP